MRKQFVRLFIGFASVALLVLLIQVGVFFFNEAYQRRVWSESVFEEYHQRFSLLLEEAIATNTLSQQTLHRALLAAMDDRVSGVVVRSSDQTITLAFGKTRGGITLSAKPANRTTRRIRIPSYTIELNAQTFSLREERSIKSQRIPLSSEVGPSDIAGSFTLTVNGEEVGYIDVLTYTPFTYKSTSFILKALVAPFIWSIPLSLILALILGAVISKRTQRYSDEISLALEELSRGENNVQLPKPKYDEQETINASIEALDQTLLHNKLSRQAWLRSISHDFNTPLTAMGLLLEGIQDEVFPLSHETITKVQSEHALLNERIAQVSLYAHLLGQEPPIDQRPFNANEFAKEMLQSTESERIELAVNTEELVGDRTLLGYAAKALLSNAFNASNEPIRWVIDFHSMVFTNKGLLPQEINFFEPWERGDRARSSSGSGMGLPIVHQIMRLHQGNATIEQQKDEVKCEISW